MIYGELIENMDRNYLAQDKDNWQPLVKAVLKHLVPLIDRKFLDIP
jgi:hypothetical protein